MARLDAIALASWLNAVLAQKTSICRAVAEVQGSAPNCVVATQHGQVETLATTMPRWLEAGLLRASVALPVPGDPVGLAGPANFNEASMEAEGSAILGGIGLGVVPSVDARTLVWTELPALPPATPLDLAEADQLLRQSLQHTTASLVELDVASWQPEIPDLLLNLRHRLPESSPNHWSTARAACLDRALVCLEIVELAQPEKAGTFSAHQMQARRESLRELDRASRRALVAACSAEPGLG